MKTSLIAAIALLSLSAQAEELPKLNLDIDQITVSGLSSGGFMANQFHIAHSNWVAGAGIIAAGPYYCAKNDISVALSQCVNKVSSEFDFEAINTLLDDYQQQGKVDELTNLKHSKVWILHGVLDKRVIEPVTNALHQQYAQWLDSSNLKYVNDKPFAHHFPTLNAGSECAASEAPFLGNCDYDAAGNMLAHIVGDLKPKATQAKGKLVEFDQQTLGKEPAESLADTGYLYIPKSCQQGQSCQIHVSFHGCNQNANAVGDAYVAKSGLNPWAESNNLVILYPQTKKSAFLPLNPQGCWDWWGYTGEDYANAAGPQIQAVENMVQALAGALRNKN